MKRETQDKLWAVLTEEERRELKKELLMVDISNDFWLGKCTCIQGIFGTHHLLSKPNLASSKPNLASNVASSEIDWEQRRYEVAKDLLAARFANPNSQFCDKRIEVDLVVEYTDALIYALKSKKTE